MPAVFSHTKWEQAIDTQMPDQEWHRSLGALLKYAMTTHRVALDRHDIELHLLDLDVGDEANDACHQLLLLAERIYEQYESNVGDYHRTRVEDHHAPSSINELR
ncbi:hypothetical protein [Halomicrococcus sp. NG-SE-24]|uniref:hypothetical protein n=1 Tax=Halomicrococcus sp. NG-SE-24 TaxID=3436928 RepID=UPI003D988B79